MQWKYCYCFFLVLGAFLFMDAVSGDESDNEQVSYKSGDFALVTDPAGFTGYVAVPVEHKQEVCCKDNDKDAYKAEQLCQVAERYENDMSSWFSFSDVRFLRQWRQATPEVLARVDGETKRRSHSLLTTLYSRGTSLFSVASIVSTYFNACIAIVDLSLSGSKKRAPMLALALAEIPFVCVAGVGAYRSVCSQAALRLLQQDKDRGYGKNEDIPFYRVDVDSRELSGQQDGSHAVLCERE